VAERKCWKDAFVIRMSHDEKKGKESKKNSFNCTNCFIYIFFKNIYNQKSIFLAIILNHMIGNIILTA